MFEFKWSPVNDLLNLLMTMFPSSYLLPVAGRYVYFTFVSLFQVAFLTHFRKHVQTFDILAYSRLPYDHGCGIVWYLGEFNRRRLHGYCCVHREGRGRNRWIFREPEGEYLLGGGSLNRFHLSLKASLNTVNMFVADTEIADMNRPGLLHLFHHTMMKTPNKKHEGSPARKIKYNNFLRV